MSEVELQRVVLKEADCQTIAQGLRVFARQLVDRCRHDVGGGAIPAEVTDQAQRLETVADRIGETGEIDCCVSGLIVAIRGNTPFLPLDLPAGDWRAASGALMFMAQDVRSGGDKPNGRRLENLAGQVEMIGRWNEAWRQSVRCYKEAREANITDDTDADR